VRTVTGGVQDVQSESAALSDRLTFVAYEFLQLSSPVLCADIVAFLSGSRAGVYPCSSGLL
jgi:hypothetical protein